MTILQYLKRELAETAQEFMREWRSLSREEQADLRKAAEIEMNVLGVEITSNKA